MIFLISLCLALLFSVACSEQLRKNPVRFYIGAVAISVVAVILTWTEIIKAQWFNTWVLPIVSRGALAGALFVIVMYAGVFPARSLGAKTFMPIRGQLSILACILTLCHNVAYGKVYFAKLFFERASLSTNMLIASIFSLVMIIVMLPLFVTSFQTIRKKMKGTSWKKLQRAAYLFYGLLFAHVMMLTVPRALTNTKGYDITVFVYAFVFISYFVCRILKALSKKSNDLLPRRQLIGAASSIFAATVVVAAISSQAKDESISYSKTEIVAQGKGDVSVEKEQSAVEIEESEALKDGTYTGEGMGNNGTIAVEVTIADGELSDIVITKFVDDKEYFNVDTDGKEMISRVLEAGSSDVDTIAGATYSSKGFLSAVDKALEQAKQ